ncbi:MAG: hypothetical protein UU63_C0051G0013 [Candidatus Uhrbacteria bacterium GW2011_GWF2_41_430]|nr:MAG: hypothetical protein UU63_C0051G0013 [Candidatus Uhrbacteria bacterium GW2011_GWF2_41_430]
MNPTPQADEPVAETVEVTPEAPVEVAPAEEAPTV